MKSLHFTLLSCLSLASSFSTNRVFVGTPSKTNPLLVKDCMTLNPTTLKTTDTVDEAIQELLRMGFNGAPVVDPGTDNLVGVVSAFDFLLKENGGALLEMHGTKEEMMEMAQAARKICATTVGHLMTPIACSISPNMSMKEAAAIMTMDRVHRMCVVDDEGKLIGILSTSDVMKDVLNVVKRALPEAHEEEPNSALAP
jgi:CBS domain-containing protein